jgi:hypothetical protein
MIDLRTSEEVTVNLMARNSHVNDVINKRVGNRSDTDVKEIRKPINSLRSCWAAEHKMSCPYNYVKPSTVGSYR